MNNFLPEIVEVTSYVVSGAYQPKFCANDGPASSPELVTQLIRTSPRRLTSSDESGLQQALGIWTDRYNRWRIANGREPFRPAVADLYRRTQYDHTYLLGHSLIDVYRTDLGAATHEHPVTSLYIRLDETGELFDVYQADIWVDCRAGGVSPIPSFYE